MIHNLEDNGEGGRCQHYSEISKADFASQPSVTMSLLGNAESDTARRALGDLANHVFQPSASRLRPSSAYTKALSATIADLFKAASFTPPRSCFRRMGAGDFTGSPVGYHTFSRVLRDLERTGFIRRVTGQAPTKETPGIVTRVIPSIRFMSFMADRGVLIAERASHFTYPRQHNSQQPLQLKTGRTYNAKWKKVAGKKLPIDLSHPKASIYAYEVQRLNAYLSHQRFSLLDDVAMFRGFNLADQPNFDWNKGGRLYCYGGGYQSLSKGARSEITINDLTTTEIDISACHITIAHGICRTPLPNRTDLYAVEGIPRQIVKNFVTLFLGQGKVPIRWTADHRRIYDATNPKRLNQDYPISAISKHILASLPVLKTVSDRGLSWADFQFAESEAMISALLALADKHDVCGLPVHDSLIIPTKDVALAKDCLRDSFYAICNIQPTINI